MSMQIKILIVLAVLVALWLLTRRPVVATDSTAELKNASSGDIIKAPYPKIERRPVMVLLPYGGAPTDWERSAADLAVDGTYGN